MTKNKLLAVVRVRGKINLAPKVKRTIQQLNLFNKNWCVFIENTETNLGMIGRVKDFVTYGEVSEDVLKELVTKRGKIAKDDNFIMINKKKYKKYFRLSPPKKGYGRKGVKISYNDGGALGYRSEKINDLLKRMI